MFSRFQISRTMIAALLVLVMVSMPAASFAADNADAAVDQAGATGTIPVIKFTKKINDKKNYKLYSAKKGKKSFKQYFKISKTTGKVTVYDA